MLWLQGHTMFAELSLGNDKDCAELKCYFFFWWIQTMKNQNAMYCFVAVIETEWSVSRCLNCGSWKTTENSGAYKKKGKNKWVNAVRQDSLTLPSWAMSGRMSVFLRETPSFQRLSVSFGYRRQWIFTCLKLGWVGRVDLGLDFLKLNCFNYLFSD